MIFNPGTQFKAQIKNLLKKEKNIFKS